MRGEGSSDKLTRIVIEFYDGNAIPLFPSIVDVKPHTSLTYVRTGPYEVDGEPSYCRVSIGHVDKLTYNNQYPEK